VFVVAAAVDFVIN